MTFVIGCRSLRQNRYDRIIVLYQSFVLCKMFKNIYLYTRAEYRYRMSMLKVWPLTEQTELSAYAEAHYEKGHIVLFRKMALHQDCVKQCLLTYRSLPTYSTRRSNLVCVSFRRSTTHFGITVMSGLVSVFPK